MTENTTQKDLISVLISDEIPEFKNIPPVEKPAEPAASAKLPDPPAIARDEDLLNDPPAEPARASGAPVIDPPPAEPAASAESTRPRGRGRPPGSTNKKASFADLTPAVDFTALAGSLVDMSTGTAATVLGPEWQPRSPEERQLLVTHLAAYLKAKDVKDIPPGWMLVIVLGAYSLPRLSQPATKEKLRFGWTWLKIKVIPFFRRKRANIPKPANIEPMPAVSGSQP